MSHVATIEIEITNLQDLQAACAELGLEFEDGKQAYHCFHAGQTPEEIRDFWNDDQEWISGLMPKGFGLSDMGKCDHSIRLSDEAHRKALDQYDGSPAYEIGVVRRRDGRPGWMLLWDNFEEGYGLQRVIGENANRLKQAVATAASVRTMKAQGYRCERKQLPNGTVQLQFVRG